MWKFLIATLRFKCQYSLVLAGMAILLTAASCSTNDKPAPADYHSTSRTSSVPAEADEIERRLLRAYSHWQGTGHKMGGSTRKGIDCSGFVQRVYRDVFQIDLPRTTAKQVKRGKSVFAGELQPGDLVFFKPPGYPRHVGIYLSRSEFLHVSKTSGVTMSTIDAHYWGKYYWTARRILPVTETR